MTGEIEHSAVCTPDEIERIAVCTPAEFRSRYLAPGRPVLLTNLLDDWPARRRWSLDELAARFGAARVIVGHTRDGRLEVSAQAGVTQSEESLGEYLAALRAGARDRYLISPVEERIPELLEDLRTPELCRDAPFQDRRLWLGPAGVRTPLHHDLPDNLYAQIFGRKRVTLIPRRERRNVYPNPRLSRAPNFSRVDAFAPDLERFPRFGRVRPQVCEVGPGECLFIPRLWWHQVESLETSASLSLWFAWGAAALLAGLAQRYARLRQLRL